MSRYINLNDQDDPFHASTGYSGVSEDQDTEGRVFQGRVESTEAGFRGAGGNTFRNAGSQSVSNLNQIAQMIAEYAVGARGAGMEYCGSEENAVSAFQPIGSEFESQAQSISCTRQI